MQKLQSVGGAGVRLREQGGGGGGGPAGRMSTGEGGGGGTAGGRACPEGTGEARGLGGGGRWGVVVATRWLGRPGDRVTGRGRAPSTAVKTSRASVPQPIVGEEEGPPTPTPQTPAGGLSAEEPEHPLSHLR